MLYVKVKYVKYGKIGFRDLKQVVKVTLCDTAKGEECGFGTFGVNTECVQQKIEHRLVALEVSKAEEPELVVDTFMFPSCCSCVMR